MKTQALDLHTEIRSNGSKWYGEEPDNIETLLGVLAECKLDERHFDGFIHHDAGYREVYFFGNFEDVSHVFSIHSNDPAVVAPLTKAIVSNILRQHPRINARIRRDF